MSKSAVIIGDLQVGITEAYPWVAELVPPAAALAAAARQNGDLVVFVTTRLRTNGGDVSPRNPAIQAIFSTDDTYHEGSDGVELDPGLGRLPGDVVVAKHRASAFAGTDLEMVLRGKGIDTLVVAGVATSAMVAATVYDAADRDYQVRVARDVCGDPLQEVHEFFIGTVFPGRGVEVFSGVTP